MPPGANALLTTLLRDVSRSFYLTLRVLPRTIRPQIGLAYLLARTTDTIADTAIVPVDRRLQALEALRLRILGDNAVPLAFGELASGQASTAERTLLERVESSLALLAELDPEDLRRVRTVLGTIVGGQSLDLRRFGRTDGATIVALGTDAELDDYTYRVAGCVGEFWTHMCRAHLFPQADLDETALLWDAVRFGKGLQLVNILRDLPRDLHQGRCYVPTELLGPRGLEPVDLLDRAVEPRFRPVYNPLLDRAEAHLRAGWKYTNALPPGHARVRLACAWPILIGMETIRRLRTENVLDPSQRIKVPRSKVRAIVLRSLIAYPFPGWRRQI